MGDPIKGMKIAERFNQLRKYDKKRVVEIFQRTSRLDLSYAKSEPKDSLISEILESEFGRGYYSHLEAYRDSLKRTLRAVRRKK